MERRTRGPELAALVLAVLGAGLAVWAAWSWWGYLTSPDYAPVRPYASLWPVPGLYLAELALLALWGLVAAAMEARRGSGRWGASLWLVIGALGGLALLGVWSIGTSVVPSLLAFTAAGTLLSVARRRGVAAAAGRCALAFFLQAALMLLMLLGRAAATPF